MEARFAVTIVLGIPLNSIRQFLQYLIEILGEPPISCPRDHRAEVIEGKWPG